MKQSSRQSKLGVSPRRIAKTQDGYMGIGVPRDDFKDRNNAINVGQGVINALKDLPGGSAGRREAMLMVLQFVTFTLGDNNAA